VTETIGTVEGRSAITLRGEYKNSDPAEYFKITAIPDCGYAVAEFEEYDARRRILTHAHATGHVNISGPLWLAKSKWLEKYTYDDHLGNSVQCFKVDVLEPKVVPINDNTFVLAFPRDAQVRDMTTDMDLGKIRRDTDDVLAATVATLDAYAIPAGPNGQGIVDRARDAYAAERVPNYNHEARLELPQQSGNHLWITIPIAGLVATAILIGSYMRRRASAFSRMADQQNRKEGDA